MSVLLENLGPKHGCFCEVEEQVVEFVCTERQIGILVSCDVMRICKDAASKYCIPGI
jgi:hypothetical protein